MDAEEPQRGRGRPRRHPSTGDRALAYQRRAAGRGLVRVSVLVPASRAADIRVIAGAMRQAGAAARERAGLPKADTTYPNAGRSWAAADDAVLVQSWQSGGTRSELIAGLGRPVEEVLKRLVALEEVGSVREAEAEFAARARAEQGYFQKT